MLCGALSARAPAVIVMVDAGMMNWKQEVWGMCKYKEQKVL